MPTNASTTITTPTAGAYRVDPSRTSIELATRHMFGTGRVAATFALREATLVVGDPATTTTLHAVIDAASFASNSDKRDEHVRQAKFLHVSDFPDIVVDVASATRSGDAWTATAAITARGVTAPATLTLDAVESSGDEVTLRASVRVDRYAHGIDAAKGMAGRQMDLTITAVAVRS